MDWTEAGFLIDVPDHVSAAEAAGVIRAVRSDDEAQACVPVFGDVSRDVDLWSQFLNPVDGVLNVAVNGNAIASGSPGSPLTLNFDSEGSAALNVTYPDVDLIGSTRLVFGRVVIDNAIGSELGPLDLPWRIEAWDNQTWQTHADDSCTFLDLADQVSLGNDHGSTVSGDEAIAVDGGGATTAVVLAESVLTAESGRGHFRLSAPLAPGRVEVLLGLDNGWSFLRDDLEDDDVFDNNPEARATWGLFDGDSNRILLREVMPR